MTKRTFLLLLLTVAMIPLCWNALGKPNNPAPVQIFKMYREVWKAEAEPVDDEAALMSASAVAMIGVTLSENSRDDILAVLLFHYQTVCSGARCHIEA